MPLENKQIEAMASWTLEDFQNDPLGAMTQIRNLATDYIALQRERDELAAVKVELYTAVADLKEYGTRYGFTCEVCWHKRGAEGNPCHYPADVDVDAEICLNCDRCPCGHCDGESKWEWRGKQPEQVLAPADQSAGEYADNPVLAQA